MDDFVIDTNVWVMVDKDTGEVSQAEADCVEYCRRWLSEFVSRHHSRLILDDLHHILSEYRRDIKPGGLGDILLSNLQSLPIDRLVEVSIECDNDGFAKVPDALNAVKFHRKDRKFVAVALAHNPTPTIVNAVDSDWCEKQEAIKQCGLVVHECCPNCVQETLEHKKQRKKKAPYRSD